MGIKFDCVHCGHVLHVKDYLAGKRGVCPHCQGRVAIPTSQEHTHGGDNGAVEVPVFPDDQPTKDISEQSVVDHRMDLTLPANHGGNDSGARPAASASGVATNGMPGDVIGEAPQLNWYVLPAGSMTKYGPAAGEMMRSWLVEGRVAGDSLVWREGWPQWRVASTVFPQLSAAAVSAAAVAVSPVAVAVVERPVVAAAVSSPVAQPQQPTSNPRSASKRYDSPASDSSSGSIVLAVDEMVPLPSQERKPIPRNKFELTRQQRNIIVGVLGALVALLVPIVIYMLTR